MALVAQRSGAYRERRRYKLGLTRERARTSEHTRRARAVPKKAEESEEMGLAKLISEEGGGGAGTGPERLERSEGRIE